MDKDTLQKLLKLLASENDADVAMGIRSLQGYFQDEGTDLGRAIEYAISNLGELKKQGITLDQVMTPARKTGSAPVNASGMPQCWSPKSGCIELIPSGETSGEIVQLTGEAQNSSEEIAMNLKDALVAATINKSRFKLKLMDVKNARGETIETVMQAEYDRAGMAPVRVWVNVKGEVAALAAILRKAVANAFPELVAA